MAKLDLTKLYKDQISFTEWFEKAGHADVEAIRLEDNFKRDRLAVLNEIIGLPFDKSHRFAATVLVERPPDFEKFLENHGHELCALRLIPLDPLLPKLRMRGHTIRDVLEKWFPEQNIDPTKYVAEIVPHSDNQLWSTIFIVNEHGIFGEIVSGAHSQLTQGFYEESRPIAFAYDYLSWDYSEPNSGAQEHMQKLVDLIRVTDESVKRTLREKLKAKFVNDVLSGYFETTSSNEFGIHFIDYNRVLGEMFKNFSIKVSDKKIAGVLKGQVGSPGKASGRARIVAVHEVATAQFDAGDILACEMTTPAYIPLMKKAGAIVTEFGGILSHAAIVAREFGIPCVVGVKNLTEIVGSNEVLEVDADNGLVKVIDHAG